MKKQEPKPIAVKSVTLDLAGQKITLTLDQVRELKKALDDAFPDGETVYVPSIWTWHASVPCWRETTTTDPVITWGSSSADDIHAVGSLLTSTLVDNRIGTPLLDPIAR